MALVLVAGYFLIKGHCVDALNVFGRAIVRNRLFKAFYDIFFSQKYSVVTRVNEGISVLNLCLGK